MNCQRFVSVATELARGQMMEADVRGEALAHSAGCPDCNTRLLQEEMLSRHLGSLAAEMNSVVAPASIESELLKAFRQPKVPVPVVRVSHSQRRYYWLTAVAALLLIVFGVVAVRWRGNQSPHKEIVKTPPAPVNKEVVPQKQDVLNESTAVNTAQDRKLRPRFANTPRISKSRPAQNRNNNVVSNHAEIATEFIPMGYLSEASLQEGGQIVRVEVPRSTLASFGVPVNMDRYNERVKADIVVGVDGMAHAIRFVQERRQQ